MMVLGRPAFVSAAALAFMALGIKWLLGYVVVPRMTERGNVLMVKEVVEPLENYFADYQEWPAGKAEETMWRLQGAKNDLITEKEADAAGPSIPGPVVGNEDAAGVASTVRRQATLPSVNYLRGARVASAGPTLADAWGHPLEFSFIPDGPATVTSLGADGVVGTVDDVTATASIMPRRTYPTHALLIADREARRAEVASRMERARKLAEKAK